MTQWRNAKYTPDGLIDCEIYIKEEWMPTTVDASDVNSLYDSQNLFSEITSSGNISPADPVIVPQITEEDIRNKRNYLLDKSDWTQVDDSPVDKIAWATYRQQLRDITLQTGFPTDVVWPTKPENV